MTKDEFLAQLTHRLGFCPYEELRKMVDYYREAIEDRIEEGMTEEEAVAAMGPLDDIVKDTAQSQPLSTVVRERVRTEREKAERKGSEHKTLWIVLLVAGFPIWFPLAITVLALFFAMNVTLFALLIAAFAVAISIVVAGAVAIAGAVLLPYQGIAPRLMLIGAGVLVIGIGILLFPLAGAAEKGLVRFIKYVVGLIKRAIVGGRPDAV